MNQTHNVRHLTVSVKVQSERGLLTNTAQEETLNSKNQSWLVFEGMDET